MENDKTIRQEAFTKPVKDGKISYIEREVDKFDFDGYEVVRREFFSKALCPAVTIKYGLIKFNVCAIRKLGECSHIQILMNSEKKLMIAKPCDEDEKDSVQWSRIDKRGKVVPRDIRGKIFTAQLFDDMKWNPESTVKTLGTLLKCKDEKLFVFELVNAETYISISALDPDNPKRRNRIPTMPQHWDGNYGQSYEDSKIKVVETFEGMPEDFVKISIQKPSSKKTTIDMPDLFNNNNETTEDGNV